ncbi:unnamed protein product [Musa acuminata subsp. malaccensis]|uniref:(wild Malaysian banana) hypothetical protein n=1 Tax=Musa acuminata subsp. malaccensis TaxID=214687 RepID=A0A8D6ZQB4_MUSAM|nr:unnamed protein product [Musa acuminata subsp. malaccensis]
MQENKRRAMESEEEEGKQRVPVLVASPSFREPFAEADDLLDPPPPVGTGDGGDESDVDDDDSEFAFVVKDPETGPAITAAEIFSNGQIRPIYPVFDRSLLLANGDDDRGRLVAEGEEKTAPLRRTLGKLLIEEREEHSASASSSSSSLGTDELEGIPPGTYCVWAPRSTAPSASRCKKSRSTGSSLRWRLRDLVIGRSQSDGKEKFVFLAAKGEEAVAAVSEESKKEKAKARDKGGKPTEVDGPTAHRVYYGKGRQTVSGAARRSFLPYNQNLIGFFANVNGLSRTHHPF